jgi:hypothetical protein
MAEYWTKYLLETKGIDSETSLSELIQIVDERARERRWKDGITKYWCFPIDLALLAFYHKKPRMLKQIIDAIRSVLFACKCDGYAWDTPLLGIGDMPDDLVSMAYELGATMEALNMAKRNFKEILNKGERRYALACLKELYPKFDFDISDE